MEEEGCIYYIFCKETGKGYVGLSQYPTPDKRYKAHWTSTRLTNYKASMLHNAMKKYGPAAFTVERLWKGPHEALPRMEEYFAEQLETYKWDSPGGYNMVWCGSKPRLGIKSSAEEIERNRQQAVKQFENPEQRLRVKKYFTNYYSLPEHKNELQERAKQQWTPEACLEMSKIKKGSIVSPEHRQKISEALKKSMTPEARQKISEASKGRKFSAETRQKLSEAAKIREEDKRLLRIALEEFLQL